MTASALAFSRRVAAVGATLALMATLCAHLCAQESAQVTRVYDLRSLLRPPAGLVNDANVPIPFMPRGWVIPDQGNSDFPPGATFGAGVVSYGNFRQPLDAEQVALRLRDVLDDDEWCEGSGGLFRIQASSGSHVRVQQTLDLLQAVARSRVRVQVFALTEAPARAVLDPEEAAALARTANAAERFDQAVFADRPRLFGAGRFRSFVRDFDLEVAQDSKLGDPKIDLLFEGLRLGVDVSPMIDGRHYARIGIQDADLADPMRSHSLGVEYLGSVHVPEVQVDEGMVAAAVPDGGGVVIAAAGGRWLVMLTRESELSSVGVPVAPFGLADLPDGSHRRVVRYPGEGDPWVSDAEIDDPLLRLDLMLGGMFGGGEAPVERVASSLLIEDAELRAQVEESLRAECRNVRTLSFELAWGAVGAEALRDAAGREEPARWVDVAASLQHHSLLPTVAGQRFSTASGVERQFVADYEVEIAQDASASNPVMRRSFAGMSAHGVVDIAYTGEPRLSIDVRWSSGSEPENFDLDVDEIGRLQLADLGLVEMGGALPMVPGRWHKVGTAPDPTNPDKRLVVLARVH